MSLVLELNPDIIEGQIGIVRRIMRLPKLKPSERHQLSELLKMLYRLKAELDTK